MFGGGILATTDPVPKGHVRLKFTPQVGGGIYYFTRPNRALFFEYRFHHISNAGQTETNPGINSSMIVFGYSLFR
jgi:hypothetical protein